MAVERVKVYQENGINKKTLQLLASKNYRIWIVTNDAFSKAFASGSIPPGTVAYITDDMLDINGDYYTKAEVDELLKEIDDTIQELTERLTTDETNIAANTAVNNTQTINITNLTNGKVSIPTSASNSNRVMIATANGTTSYYRDLSTIRATVSNGVLYLYDN